MFPVSKTQNEPEQCAQNDPKWHILKVPIMTTTVHHLWNKSGKPWEYYKETLGKLENQEYSKYSQHVPKVSLIYPKSGALWLS